MKEEATDINRPATLSLVLSLAALLVPPIVSGLVIIPLATSGRDLPWLSYFVHAFIVLQPLVAIVAIVLGHIARRNLRHDATLPGKGLALAGLIIGYAALAYCLTGVIVALVGSRVLKDF